MIIVVGEDILRSSVGCLFVVEGAVTGFMTHICDHSYYLCTNRQHCMYLFSSNLIYSLAKKRIASCGLQDRVTVICTEITRDRYMSQLVGYLQFYNAHFDTVISMLPSGDGLIQFVNVQLFFEYRLSFISSNIQLRVRNHVSISSVGLIVSRHVILYSLMRMLTLLTCTFDCSRWF